MPNYSLSDAVFEEAARLFPTPFHLYDERGIRNRIRTLKEAFSWADFKEYFAVKALPNPQILKIFSEEGCGLDCSSECELRLARMAGVTGRDIMFSANAMPAHELDLAQTLGAYINLDDISDIDLMPGGIRFPGTVSVRLNPGSRFPMSNAIMGTPEESKYGWLPEQLCGGLRIMQREGLHSFGLHAFVCSNCMHEEYYAALARYLLEEGLHAERETGLHFAFINLSGGLGIPYRPEEKPLDIGRIGSAVRDAYLAALGTRRDIAVYMESGRYMTGPYGWLVSHVTHKKEIYKTYIGLDACASNLMRPAMYGAYHEIHICGKRDMPPAKNVDITGCLCENNDKFAVDRPMPPVEIGDLAVIHDTGAHGWSMGYQYNGRLRSAEVLYCEDGSFRLIRRAETPEDYFATLL